MFQKLRRPENAFLAAVIAVGMLQGLVIGRLGEEVPKRSQLAFGYALSIAIANWVMVDSVRCGRRRPFIMGLLLLQFWNVIAPWHLFQTRRWKGFLTLGIFVALLCVVWLSEIVGMMLMEH